MIPQEIIRKKRDGGILSAEEIAFFVSGLTRHSLSEGQVAAFAMAVFFQGMTVEEMTVFTEYMSASGTLLDWSDLPGPVVDKQSTGGVGDKVSLILGPIIAACGGFNPMISGHGLGHSGGTLDKLDAVPGYNTAPDSDLFRDTVKTVGTAIIGQTGDLAPADKRFDDIRDVTATVESIPLMTVSILSKKLAAGLDALVMDIKTGSGAPFTSHGQAVELAESIVAIANGNGIKCSALITDMDQVLGRSVGNALEVNETIAYLTSRDREPRLNEVVLALAGEMLWLGGLVADPAEGFEKAAIALETGSAAERFAKMIASLGGPTDLLEKPERHLTAAPVIKPVPATKSGFVTGMKCRDIGVAVIGLGGGRTGAGQPIDHRVGFTQIMPVGSAVGPDQPLAMVHAASDTSAEAAIAAMQSAYVIGESPSAAPQLIPARISHCD